MLRNKIPAAVTACFAAVLFLISSSADCETNAGSAELTGPPAPELQVKPFRIFSSGPVDSSATAINPPDGLAFTDDGLLIATDAMNHRIQIFNPITGEHLGKAGDAGQIVGMIVNVISLPDGGLLVSDEIANQAYRFDYVAGAKAGFRLSGAPLLKGDGFARLNGLACDSKNRIYAVDGQRGEVRRYLPDFKPDPEWKFQATNQSNRSLLNQSEAIAACENTNTLFVTSERDGAIHAFNLETGEWLAKTVGCRTDASTGKPLGRSVFQRSIEGLAIMGDYLLAVDEGQDESPANRPGRVLLFDLRSPVLYETGFEECRSRMAAGAVEGLVGWFGSYRSPDAVAVFPGSKTLGAMIAVADQGAYQVLVFWWKDVLEALQKSKSKKRPHRLLDARSADV